MSFQDTADMVDEVGHRPSPVDTVVRPARHSTSPSRPNRFRQPFASSLLRFLPILAAYLISGALVTDRTSPPTFYTIALILTAAAFFPTAPVAAACSGLALFAQLFLALDHIHGHCGDNYAVLIGGEAPFKKGLGSLAWYRQCVQPAHAWWVMVLINVLWLFAFASEVFHSLRPSRSRIALPMNENLVEIPASLTTTSSRISV
ncbi:hypothetical protein BCR39DRAFT_508759 [Naematelia encephala]|uniref:Uncharacterized protein n=1 Tax=Naematelia encephala TaxID=71784 RepID=A0A1Y2BKN3_9TREE|nr:hypothetical protein BCR39DRAFT_508759 [Naematelia encephala]